MNLRNAVRCINALRCISGSVLKGRRWLLVAHLFWNWNSRASLAAEHLMVCNSSLTSTPASLQREFAYPSKPWAGWRACSAVRSAGFAARRSRPSRRSVSLERRLLAGSGAGWWGTAWWHRRSCCRRLSSAGTQLLRRRRWSGFLPVQLRAAVERSARVALGA